jgi:CheY-like chemotaxis protein
VARSVSIDSLKHWEDRSSDQESALPAVALTAYARSEDRTKAMRSGFQIHLAKPVEPAELVAVVRSLAGRKATIAVEPN